MFLNSPWHPNSRKIKLDCVTPHWGSIFYWHTVCMYVHVNVCMFRFMLPVQVRPAWIWTCSIDRDMQQAHRHKAWTWTCSMDATLYFSMLHAQVYSACPGPCCMSQYMLRVHVYAACPYIYMLHCHAMLHVHVLVGGEERCLYWYKTYDIHTIVY